MCINFRTINKAQILSLNLTPPQFPYGEESYPKDNSPILLWMNGRVEWRSAQFGLLPSWSKDKDYKAETHNARVETVDRKVSFQSAWQNNQFALVPMQAFYEPRYGTTPQSERWRIERQDQRPFMAAAIYEIWREKDETIYSFSLITINADAHPLMNQFHKADVEKRSIVVLPRPQWKRWLQADHRNAKSLLQDIDPTQFHAYADARLITKTPSLNLDLF